MIQVLLVDDDSDDRLMMLDLFSEIRDYPCTVTHATTYAEALLKMEHNAFNILIVDYRLGAQTGLDLLQELQQRKNSTPLILLTGYGDEELDMKALKKGVSDYLVKSQLSHQLLERSIRYTIARANAFQELRDSQEQLRNLFDSTFEGIIIHDKHGEMADLNQTAMDLLGKAHEKPTKRNLKDHISEDSFSMLLKMAEKGRPLPLRTEGVKTSGEKIDLELVSKPYPNKESAFLLTACRDIRESIQLQEQLTQQDRLASIGLLASSLAHEIGTPLGVIRGRAELLESQIPDEPEITKTTQIIVSQIDRVSKLITTLLGFSRSSKGIQIQSVGLLDILTSIQALLEPQLRHEAIQTTFKIDPKLEVLGDSNKLQQVFLNLFINSIHAIESVRLQGRPTRHEIEVSALAEDGFWVIQVRDTGCGISKSTLNNLFQPFFTTKDVGKGTGLGLSISLKLIHEMNGEISVSSQENIGTIFTLRLKKPGGISNE